MNWILAYWQEIDAGRVVVPARIHKVYSRLVDEINNPVEPWHFDEKKANRPIEFIEKFCRHSKGEWSRKPIKLELFQKAYISALYGFVDADGMRRYNETLFVVARKNGKSTMTSGIGTYMLVADGEGGAEVYSVATKKDQARIVFNEAVNMVRQSPDLSRRIKKRKTDLYFDMTFGKFEPLGSGSNTLDGLNTHCCIMDELHAIKDRGLYEVMKQSMSARRQPLLFMITTSGTVRECIYDEMYDYACKVADGQIDDEHFLPIIYELDKREEWTDPSCWMKANPGLGTIKKYSDISQKVERAKNSPADLPGVLTKDFNVRDTVAGMWLTFDEADNTAAFEQESLKGMYAIAGVDLSSTTDLTCATLIVMRKNDPVKYVIQHYFMPAELVEQRMREDGRVPYDKWHEAGLLSYCDGNKVRFNDVTAWLWRMHKECGIHPMRVYYDRWSATYWVDEMIDTFDADIIGPHTAVAMGAKTLSQPMKEMGADLRSKLINYNNNPILKWCLTNVALETDKNENIRPIKGKNQRLRIDGAVSLLIAYTGLFNYWNEYKAYLKAG